MSCQNPDCRQYYPIPHASSVPDLSQESGPQSGPSSGAGPSRVYRFLDGDSSSPDDDIRPPSEETIRVHRGPPIESGPGEMVAIIRATPAEIDLLLENIIKQAVSVKRSTQEQGGQECWRLILKEVGSPQQLEWYYQWCLQIHHCYCRFHREHPRVPVRTAAETIEIDAGSLEKVLKEAFLKAWAPKKDKQLWIQPPFHLLGEVVPKIKEDCTDAFFVVPVCDWRLWWKDVLAITVDSIRLLHDVNLYARDNTGPLRQGPWPTIVILVGRGLISDGRCTSHHGSESSLDHGTESDSNFFRFFGDR